MPWLRLGFSYGGIALARKSIHSFYCDIGLLRRCVLVHEVAHLLTPRDPAHGTTFTAALLHMWELELGIAREHALVIAARLGVAVAGSEVLTNTSTNTNTVDSTGDACVASLPL